jgi:cell division protein FtsB
MWRRRIEGLHSRIDADALDERARAMLNLSDPRDVIVPYDKGQRLF